MLREDSVLENLKLYVVQSAWLLVLCYDLRQLTCDSIGVELSIELAEDHDLGKVEVVIEVVVQHRVELLDWHLAGVYLVALDVVRQVCHAIDVVVLKAGSEEIRQVMWIHRADVLSHIRGQLLQLRVCMCEVIADSQVFEHVCTDMRGDWNLVYPHCIENELKLSKKDIFLVISFVKAHLADRVKLAFVVFDFL